jgi:hypothetical protein
MKGAHGLQLPLVEVGHGVDDQPRDSSAKVYDLQISMRSSVHDL